MLSNRSIMHVNQDLGKVISNNPKKVMGYYNNLTDKVILQPNLLHTDTLPVYKTRQGEHVVFPVDVFQYGLGAYDLFLMTSKNLYKKKFLQCVEWAYMNQEESGGWNTFFSFIQKLHMGLWLKEKEPLYLSEDIMKQEIAIIFMLHRKLSILC